MNDKNNTASKTLCIISTVVLVLSVIATPFFIVMWVLSGLGGNAAMTDSFTFLILAGGFGFFVSLVLAIIAKSINTKSIYATVCIIISAIPVLITIVLAVILSSYVRKVQNEINQMERARVVENYTGEWEDEVQACLDRHQFDIADINFDYVSDEAGNDLVLLIYISRDAQQTELDQINDFLHEIRDLCFAYEKTVQVIPCYFDPDDEDLDYTTYFWLTGDEDDILIDIDMNRSTSSVYSWFRPENLPDRADDCNVLLVVY